MQRSLERDGILFFHIGKFWEVAVPFTGWTRQDLTPMPMSYLTNLREWRFWESDPAIARARDQVTPLWEE